jgi:hypothetical protein
LYDGIRPAAVADVTGIIDIIEPLMQAGREGGREGRREGIEREDLNFHLVPH